MNALAASFPNVSHSYQHTHTLSHAHDDLEGVCFGHQVIARALDGSCVLTNGRYEVAVTAVQLTQQSPHRSARATCCLDLSTSLIRPAGHLTDAQGPRPQVTTQRTHLQLD
jgi:hypothetical protein